MPGSQSRILATIYLAIQPIFLHRVEMVCIIVENSLYWLFIAGDVLLVGCR